MADYTSGDTAPALAGTCADGTSAVDLTTTTVEIHVRRPDQTVITRAATSIAADGGWTLDLTTTDLTIAGTYQVEAQVTYSDDTVQTYGAASFDVRKEIA